MRNYKAVLAVCALGAVLGLAGCSVSRNTGRAAGVSEESAALAESGAEGGHTAKNVPSQRADAAVIRDPSAPERAPELEGMKPEAGFARGSSVNQKSIVRERDTEPETPFPVSKSKSYYMVTDGDSLLAPCLTLFEDQTFGFTCDVLSSYYPNGTYRIEGDRLTAVTKDESYTYVFQVDGDKYIFLEDESSDAALIDREVGVPVTDKAVFALREPEEEELEQMRAVVKEIKEDSLLVSSRSNENPGAFYVYFGENDIRGIKPGDEVRILWDGTVLETDPAQIYAHSIQRIE